MFEKFKELKQLRDLQKQIAAHHVEASEKGVTLIMRGDFSLEKITLNSALDTAELERTLMRLFEQARSKIQSDLASRFSQGM